jgi:uncharacterized protein (DUF305 family)
VDGGVVLAAGCTPPTPHHPTAASVETDVRFAQHMVGHLRQTTSITLLTRDRIDHPALRRLADELTRRGHAHVNQLQEWLAAEITTP